MRSFRASVAGALLLFMLATLAACGGGHASSTSRAATATQAAASAGEPTETDEAVPLWAPLDALPFDRMWADDRLWLPHLVEGRRFRGRFVFDGDRMVDHVLFVDD